MTSPMILRSFKYTTSGCVYAAQVLCSQNERSFAHSNTHTHNEMFCETLPGARLSNVQIQANEFEKAQKI